MTYISHSLQTGGSERQMVALAERLPKDEFSIRFVLFEEAGPLVSRARAAGATVVALGPSYDLGTGRLSRTWRRTIRGIYLTTALARELRRETPDVVDAWLFHAYLAAGLSRPLSRIRALVAGRRSMSDARGADSWLYRALGRVASRAADVIVANSDAVRADSINRDGDDPSKVVVIPNGVDIPPTITASDRAEVRRRWGITDGEVVLVCVANLKPGKGHDWLIRSFAPVVATHPSTVLVLIGEGPLREQLELVSRELGIRDRVRFAGLDADAARSIRAADIAVLASQSEGLPNAVLEASAAALPVIATSVGGTPEVILQGRTGVLISVDDREALRIAMADLVADRDLRVRMGAAGRDRVADIFSMTKMAGAYAALYRSLIKVT